MSTATQTPDRTPLAHSHGGPGDPLAPAKTRAAAVRSTDPSDFASITGREEEWRFTPVKRLRGLHNDRYTLAAEKLGTTVENLPDGVTLTHAPMSSDAVGAALTPFDRPSAVAYQNTEQAQILSVAPRTHADAPVTLRVHGESAEGAHFAHTVIDVGAEAELTIVVDHTGSVTLADNIEIRVGQNAHVKLVSLAEWDADSVQLQHQKAVLEKDAHLTHISVSLGGQIVRQFLSAEFAGSGAEFEALGIYFADEGQHLEHRLLVDHNVPECRSDVNYRGALQGRSARSVWVGDVLIQADATGTDTYEMNRNLILTEGARADSVPNLEIETGEIVGAGHASATGRFDDEQLFYLQSRGIPADEARRLVVRGFFAELLNRIGAEEITQRLIESVEERLSKGAR